MGRKRVSESNGPSQALARRYEIRTTLFGLNKTILFAEWDDTVRVVSDDKTRKSENALVRSFSPAYLDGTSSSLLPEPPPKNSSVTCSDIVSPEKTGSKE